MIRKFIECPDCGVYLKREECGYFLVNTANIIRVAPDSYWYPDESDNNERKTMAFVSLRMTDSLL